MPEEAYVGHTLSSNCSEIPFSPPGSPQSPVLYQRNPFHDWKRGKCYLVTVAERNLLPSVVLGLPQNAWIQMLTVSSEASLNSQRVRFSEAFPNSGLLSQHAGIRAFKAQLWLRTGPAAAANMYKGPGSQDGDAVPLYGETVSKLPLLTACQRLGLWNPWLYPNSLELDKDTTSWPLAFCCKISQISLQFYFLF